MIETGRPRIPWSWVVLMTLPVGVNSVVSVLSSTALTFTLNKFTDDPALITFLVSMNVAFQFLAAPYAAWKSDQIWTRFGRRRPFLLVGWAAVAVGLFLIPLAGSLWQLVPCMVIYMFCQDFGYVGVWTPLFWEVIPSPQRGRAAMVKRTMSILGKLYFNYYLIRQFNTVTHFRLNLGPFGLRRLTITGEELLYWSIASLAAVMTLHILLNIRETPPKDKPASTKFSLIRYVKMFTHDRQWRLLFVLQFCVMALSVSLGPLAVLLVTKQFGYSKATLGMISTYTLIFDFCVVMPLAALIVDRFDRFRIFQVGMFVAVLHPIVFWLYVKFAAPNHIPGVWPLIGFSLALAMADLVAVLALEPLIMDFIPRNMMGTICSGMIIVNGLLALLIGNGVGVWVKYYSRFTMPKGQYDYMSGYLYVFAVGALGCVTSVYFGRQLRAGRLIPYGKLEAEAAGRSAAPSPESPSGFYYVTTGAFGAPGNAL